MYQCPRVRSWGNPLSVRSVLWFVSSCIGYANSDVTILLINRIGISPVGITRNNLRGNYGGGYLPHSSGSSDRIQSFSLLDGMLVSKTLQKYIIWWRWVICVYHLLDGIFSLHVKIVILFAITISGHCYGQWVLLLDVYRWNFPCNWFVCKLTVGAGSQKTHDRSISSMVIIIVW